MPAYWNRKWGKDAICPITHTRLRPGKNKYEVPYTIRLVCGHRFVRSALIKWIQEGPVDQSCPMCRKRIYLIDLTTMKN